MAVLSVCIVYSDVRTSCVGTLRMETSLAAREYLVKQNSIKLLPLGSFLPLLPEDGLDFPKRLGSSFETMCCILYYTVCSVGFIFFHKVRGQNVL